MRKSLAFLAMILIAALFVGVDYFVLTSSRSVSRTVRGELTRYFGNGVTFREASLSGGSLVMEGVEYSTAEHALRPLAVEQIEIQFYGGKIGGRAETVLLRNPRLSLSDDLIEELNRHVPKGSIQGVFSAGNLPRVVCRGGTIEAIFPEILAPENQQALSIREISFTPIGGYRYHVNGTLESAVFGAWRVEGEFDLDSHEQRLLFRTLDLQVGPKLRECFGTGVRRVWDRYQPEGRCDLVISAAKAPGSDLDFRATLIARDMGLVYQNFPYKVEHVAGEIDFFIKGFRVKHMAGRHGGARVQFDGVGEDYPATAAYAFRIDIDDMPLDGAVRAALDKDAQRVWDSLTPAGRVDVHGHIVRPSGPDRPVDMPLEISVHDATLRCAGFPYELRNVAGDLRLESSDVTIKRLTARDGPTAIEVTGKIEDIAGEAGIDLVVAARSFPLDDRLKEALPESARKTWEELSPGGKVDVRWHVEKEKGKDKEPVHRAAARARGVTATYRPVPLPLSEIEGDIEIEPGRLILRHLTAKSGKAEIQVRGTLGDETTSLHLDASNFSLDESVLAALPPEAAEVLRMLKLGGTLAFNSNLTFRKNGKREIDLGLRLSRGVIGSEPRIEDMEGSITLTGSLVNGKPSVMGFLNCSQATVAGKRLKDIAASFHMEGSKISFVNIKASAYGGQISGPFFSIDAENGDFSGAFAVDRLDIKEYSADTKAYQQKTLAGKASLEIREFSGKAGDMGSIQGTGRLEIHDGQLWDVPIFISLFTLNLQQPLSEKNQFDAGVVDFKIGDRKFTIDRLAFSSESVSLVGRGRINFDGDLNLVLKTQTGFLGIDFFLVRWVTRTFDFFKDAFWGVEVTGTFEKPETSQKLFPGFKE